ncbi:MAG: hypothetical protein EOQ82_26505 [Mesorhizobium sp.]|uniref:hypothetical protein n=1 Tax=Mesorhizobium sp. TaxID=1871066 RepID=UPI000FE509D2|nr:hypothetical protein [Mesorhizobium sp.]RWH52252.1 MAG: hypothetical protein EOQ82_26505 [Mesorhizobium sp.]
MRWTIVASVFCAIASAAQAETKQELAKMSGRSWSALECAALAGFLKREEDNARLFKGGYDQGKRFIEAYLSGELKAEDANKEIPFGMSTIMQGPNVDFMLGRLWDMTSEAALKPVYEVGGVPNDPATWNLKAAIEYENKNCDLLD